MHPVRLLALAVLTLGVAGCRHAPPPRPAAPPGVPAIPLVDDAAAAGARSPHDFRGTPLCQRCHLPDASLRAEPVALCVACHTRTHASHPVDVVQRTGAPGLPLLADGRVACHSCHDPHVARREPRRNPAALRLGGSALCLRCHPGY